MSKEAGAYGPGDGSIRKIKCPAAFTSGDKDIVIPVETVESNVEAMGSLAKLICYRDCGHSPLVDCAKRLEEDIRTFFG